jgi:hypothetical protein
VIVIGNALTVTLRGSSRFENSRNAEMTGHFLSGIAELDRTNKTFEDSGALRQG